jgi:acyl carrier protein
MNKSSDELKNFEQDSSVEYCNKINSCEDDLVKETVKEIWMKVFKIERTDTSMDFFTFGGSSLQAARIISRIRKKLEVKLKMVDLLNNSSLENLIKVVKSKRNVT